MKFICLIFLFGFTVAAPQVSVSTVAPVAENATVAPAVEAAAPVPVVTGNIPAVAPLVAGNAGSAPSMVPVAVSPLAGQTDLKHELIFDGAVYQIFNKFDGGVLTAGSGEDISPVLDRNNAGLATQKWRFEKATFGKSYLIIPTVNEKAVLDLDLKTLGIFGRMVSFGNQRYWKLIKMGEGAVEIRNYHKPTVCLTSAGLDKEIITAECENSPAQQWVLALL